MDDYQRNESREVLRRVEFHLVAPDGITPALSENGGQPQLSINGAPFVNTAGTLVSIGYGAYYVSLTAAELASLGKVIVRYASDNTAEAQAEITVVGRDPYAGEAGPGLILHTHTELLGVNGPPDAGVQVFVTSDPEGNDEVATGITNDFGIVRFLLDAGTYYFWRQKAGRVFVNPLTVEVTP